MTGNRSITTGEGDAGATHSGAGEEVWKDSAMPEACGTLDELTCALGLARQSVSHKEVASAIKEIQEKLVDVGSALARVPPRRGSDRWLTDKDIRHLSSECKKLENRMDVPQDFIIPGESPGGSQVDFARALARRCERRVVRLSREADLHEPHLLPWLNRLSDYLWLLARLEEGADKEFSRLYPLNTRL